MQKDFFLNQWKRSGTDSRVPDLLESVLNRLPAFSFFFNNMQITNKTYIFIIDSGGAAAVCVLATSLSENPENGVLLLEVGRSD